MTPRRLITCAAFALGPWVADLEAQVVPAAPVLAEGGGQFWYSGRQLRDPLVVEIPGAGAEDCSSRAVAFDAGGDGEVSPALAIAEWDGERCVALGWWTLGPTVGIQHARASLPGAGPTSSVVVQAVSRQGARIFFGGAWTPAESSWTELVPTTSGPGELRDVDGGGVFRPVLGVDFPVWPSWHRVRLAAGAGAREMDRHFYFGVSALQALVFGPGQEGSTVDVHVGIQFSRREVGISGQRCAPDPVCARSDLQFGGIAFLVTVDGASAFKGLAGSVLR